MSHIAFNKHDAGSPRVTVCHPDHRQDWMMYTLSIGSPGGLTVALSEIELDILITEATEARARYAAEMQAQQTETVPA